MFHFVDQSRSVTTPKISHPDYVFTVFLVARGSDFAW